LSCGVANVKTGLELVEDHLRKFLGHDVCILQVCRHMNNVKLAQHHQFMNKMYVNLNMFSLSMMNRVTREIHSEHIVTVDDSSLLDVDEELLEKMFQPATLDCGVSDATILYFGARAGNHCLLLGGLGYECITEEHTLA
jgi:hypothetical protein